jgi:hypothetical protein
MKPKMYTQKSEDSEAATMILEFEVSGSEAASALALACSLSLFLPQVPGISPGQAFWYTTSFGAAEEDSGTDRVLEVVSKDHRVYVPPPLLCERSERRKERELSVEGRQQADASLRERSGRKERARARTTKSNQRPPLLCERRERNLLLWRSLRSREALTTTSFTLASLAQPPSLCANHQRNHFFCARFARPLTLSFPRQVLLQAARHCREQGFLASRFRERAELEAVPL